MRTVYVSSEQVDAAQVRVRVDNFTSSETDTRIIAISQVTKDAPVVYKGVEIRMTFSKGQQKSESGSKN